MNRSDIEQFLESSLQDGKLSRSEKSVLRSVLAVDADRSHDRDWIRNRAFSVAQASLTGPLARQAVTWLEDVMGLLVTAERPGNKQSATEIADVCFSPGQECRLRIQELLRKAVSRVDICVFTITDDRITDAIIATHDRGIEVRVISDNDKAHDAGSDLSRLRKCRIEVACDQTPDHMHHKFAVFDGRIAVSGSYNWTRSAANRNEENIVVTDNPQIVQPFQKQFDELWKRFRGQPDHHSS